MVQTRAQIYKHKKVRRSRESETIKADANVSLGVTSYSGGRKTYVSNASTNVSLAKVDPNSKNKGANQLSQSNIQRASRSATFQALYSPHSPSEEGRLQHEGHLSKLAISSAERLSDSLQLTCSDRTQVLHDASSAFKDSSIKLDVHQVQQLNSLQASGEMDTAPIILDSSVNLSNIKMPKGFHKYLEETVIASTAKTLSEQDTLEERSHSTFDSQTSSPSPRKAGDTRRNKERHESQQLFQVVLDNDSKQQTSINSLPSETPDFSQNTTLNTPLAARPFGRKRNRSVDKAEYKIALSLSTTFSPRKYSSRIGDDLSQQSISVTPQGVQPFGERRKRMENANKHKFADILSQQSPRLSPQKCASGIWDVSQQSIPKSPQAVQPFGKRQKISQIEDNFEDILSQSSSGLSPLKFNSRIHEVSCSSICKSPQTLQPVGDRKKRFQNEDNFGDKLRQSSRTSPNKLNSKTGKVSHSSISKSLEAVQPRQKSLQNDNFENMLTQSSPRLSRSNSNSRSGEASQSSISKSPQPSQPFRKRHKRLQNVNKFGEILNQPSPAISTQKHSAQSMQSYNKKQKKKQIEDYIEGALHQSPVRLSPNTAAVKTGEDSQQNSFKMSQSTQPFGKRQKRTQNGVNFQDILSKPSPILSPMKSNSKIGDDSWNSSTELSPSTQLFNEVQKRIQREDNFEGRVNQSPRTSPRKLNSKTGKVSKNSTSKSLQTAQLFSKKHKKLQSENNYEVAVSHSSPRISPRELNFKTGDISQSSISNSPQVVQPFAERQKSIQNEDNFENVLSSSSPKQPSLKTKKILQDNTSESASVLKLYGNTQKRMQNGDSCENTVSQPSPRMSPRKLATTGEVSQSSFSESLLVVQPFVKRPKGVQNNNFEDVLRQSSPRRSPRKSSSQFMEISQSSQIISSFVNRERRIQESTLPQNMLGTSSPKEIAGKSAPEYVGKTNNVPLVATSAGTAKDMPQLDKRQSINKGEILENALEHSCKIPLRKNLRSFNETNKESLENENQESFVDQSLGMALSSKTAQHITEQKNDTHDSIFETPKSMQTFGQRKMNSNECNSSTDLDHSSPKEISRDKCSMKKSIPVVDSSHKLTTDSKFKSIIEHTASAENLLAGDHELENVISFSKERKSVLKHSATPVHGSIFHSDSLESEISVGINKEQTSGSEIHVERGIISPSTFAFRKASESYIFQKNASNRCRTPNVPAVLIQTLDDSQKKSTTNSGKHQLENLDSTSNSKISEEDCKDNVVLANEKQENAPQKITEMVLSQGGADIALHRALRRSTQRSNSSHDHKNSKSVLQITSKVQSSHLKVKESSNTGHSFDRNVSDSSNNILEDQASHQSVINQKDDSPQNNARERENLNAGYELQTSTHSRVSLEHKRNADSDNENRSGVLDQSKQEDSLTVEMLREDSKKLSEGLQVKQRQKKGLNVLACEEAFQVASVSPQEITVDSICTEQHGDKLSANQELAIQLRESVMRNQSRLSPLERVENCTLTDDNSIQNPRNISDQILLAEEQLIPSHVVNNPAVKLDHLSTQKDGRANLKLTSSFEKTASHVFQNTSWRTFNSAKMDSSASSLESTTDDSLYDKLKRKSKRYRTLSQLNKFVAEVSDSSNMSENAGIEKPTFVRKRKHSLNSGNAVISTKHIANTESRAIVDNMTSAVPSEILAYAKSKVQNVTGLIGTDGNNYTGLHSKACEPGSGAEAVPGLSKSCLERRAHGQKKQRNVKTDGKQLKIPLYHQQWTKENVSHKLHLVLKSIAEGNIHQDKKLGDKCIVHPTSVDTKAKEKIIKTKKKINPALLVNGKVYRAPRLAQPKPWVNKRLYDYIMPSITARYGKANSRIKAEEYVTYLCDQVSTVIRRKNYNNYRENLEKIKKSLYHLGLIKCYNDYFVFIEKYLPFEFRYKAIPCVRAFGKHTGPPWSKDINIFADLGY